MDATQINAIDAENDFIVDNLSITEVLVKLFARGLLSKVDMARLKNPQLIDYDRIPLLLDILKRKEASFFDFLEMLIATQQQFIAQKINDTYRNLGGATPMDIKETKKVINQFGWQQEAKAVRWEINPVQDVRDGAIHVEVAGTEAQQQTAAVHLQTNAHHKKDEDESEMDNK